MEQVRVTLETAVEQADDVIMLTDPCGVIQYVNGAFERVSGHARADVLGRHVRILKSGNHDAAFYRNLWETLTRGQIWRGTFVNQRKDGRLYEDETVISPVRSDSGRLIGYLAVKHDVTTEQQTERQRRQAQHMMEIIRRVAGGVAHDVNNALMSIVGNIEMLECRAAEAGEPQEEIAEMREACERAAAVMRQLLVFGRRQVGRPVAVDVNRVVAGLEKMLRRLLGGDIALTVVSSAGPARALFAVEQIEQILIALALRASDIMMPGDGTVTITVCDSDGGAPGSGMASSSGADARWVEIRVADSGVVLDADAQARVLEGSAVDRSPSWATGLSLAGICELMQRSGGRVAVTSARGQGTTFTIQLPVAPGADEEAHPGSRGLFGSETILVAEDEDAVRDLVRLGLSGYGYVVLDAPDGATALARAAAHGGPIDVLVTDVMMPGINGYELAAHLLALHPTAKVIYMSGYPDERLLGEGVSRPGAAFLRKPFTPEVISRMVRAVLDAR
jgi:PAS domain S-box-containing protein